MISGSRLSAGINIESGNSCQLQAKEIADHMKKKSATAGGEPGVQKFVWGKKIEKDIASGASVKDFTKKAELERQRQREVRISPVVVVQAVSVPVHAIPVAECIRAAAVC